MNMIDIPSVTTKLEQTLSALRKEFGSLRTGQASVDLVDELMVDSYGVPTPMKHVAAISVPEPRMVLISPWDGSMTASIEKAILQATHLGINPVVDQKGIRLVIPPLTEDRRKALAKEASSKAENFKVEIRHTRDDLRNYLKEQLKKKEISEDENKRELDKVDAITKEYTQKIDDILAEKQAEIMKV